MYTMPGTQQAGWLPANLWKYYALDKQAQAVLAEVKKVVLNATLTTDPFMFIGGAVVLDPAVAMYRVVGTYNGAPVNEWCGDLWDRLTVAFNSWVDKNPDTTVGGGQIYVTMEGQYTELSWRKVGSSPM